ncbi:hypothetical protein D3C73_1105680 [compost metagenome]
MDIRSFIVTIGWCWQFCKKSGFRHPEGFVSCLHAKGVRETLVFRLHSRFPIIKNLVGCYFVHPVLLMIMLPIIFVARESKDLVDIPFPCPDTQMEGILVIEIRPVAVGNMMECFTLNKCTVACSLECLFFGMHRSPSQTLELSIL